MMNNLRLSVLRQAKSFLSAPISRRFFASKDLIINAVGRDRLGIVSDMTKCVTDVGGNVGESQAAKIGSHFSLVMLISVPGGKIDSLSDQLKNMSDMNANLYVLDNLSQPEPSKIGYTGLFTLEGADNPGLVHKVTTILSENGLSIDKMSTSDEIAPHGGTVLFKMQGTAHAYEPLAAGFNVAKIKEELVTLGHNLNCDINMEDVED